MDNKIYFNHEKLEVYQFSLQFIEWLNPLWKQIWKNKNIAEQLDRASISIPLNIAEGNGKSYPKDRKRYFEISRASASECASCLDVSVKKNLLSENEIVDGKEMLLSIAKMLTKLIASTMNQVSEKSPKFGEVA